MQSITSQQVEITDQEISFAENILLPSNYVFDSERRLFISNLNTIDLQAVPGSGKTTALLAKLLILEKKLPFSDGSGILVISHTNAAVNEIKRQIQNYCPKLFNYPNFIGTIQCFVDQFMAIPFYCLIKKKKPVRIDNEIYFEQFLANYPPQYLKGLTKHFSKKLFQVIEEIVTKNDKLIHFYKKDEYILSGIGETTNTYKELVKIKRYLMNQGYLNYNDAYYLAFVYLSIIPRVKNFLQNRFRFVFVDEMQDMAEHQYDLLEQVFFESGMSHSIYQRIGDKNQAIFSGAAQDEVYWVDREKVLALNGSPRLTSEIAKIVSNFALYRPNRFEIVGLRRGTIKPHLLKYSNESILSVIPIFMQKLSEIANRDVNIEFRKRLNELNTDGTNKYPVKIIAWNTEWNNDNKVEHALKIRLIDYFPDYNRNENKPKLDFPCLQAYLKNIRYDKKSFLTIQNNIINSLLKILRLERKYDSDGRSFTKKRLLDWLKAGIDPNQGDLYNTFRQKLYDWSLLIVREKEDEVFNSIKEYIPEFLRIFGSTVNCSRSFITTAIGPIEVNSQAPSLHNSIRINDIEAEVTSVHSIKGQTNSATLYLESYFQLDGRGINAKSYESQRLANQFLGRPINGSQITQRTKQSAKMAYVGLSRSTDFLCVAIHRDRFEQYLNTIDPSIWEIIEI